MKNSTTKKRGEPHTQQNQSIFSNNFEEKNQDLLGGVPTFWGSNLFGVKNVFGRVHFFLNVK